jgi:hypothetical protein
MAYIGNEPLSVAFLVDTFSGNGSTVAFTMSVAPANTSSILVAITGVVQDPSTYSVSGTTLTFSAAPPTGTSNISVRYLGIPASGVTTTAYRTVTDTTATNGQTTFTIPSYTVGYVDVFRNGVRLAAADFTATTGTTIVLVNPASAGDTITAVSFFVSSVLNAIQQYNGLSVNQVLTSPTANTLTSASGSSLQLQTNGGTTAVTLDTAQNMGLGVTPSAWALSGAQAVQVKNAGFAGYLNNAYVTANQYFSSGGGSNYIANGFANMYIQQSGQHQWFNAPSGTAGSAITFTQAMTLDASGNLGLGITPSAWVNARAIDMATYGSISADTATSAGISVAYNAYGVSATSWRYKNTYLATRYTQEDGLHKWFYAASGTAGNTISFTQGMTLDTSGNLLVGTTDVSPAAGNGVKIVKNRQGLSEYNAVSVVSNANNAGMSSYELYTSTGGTGYKFYVLYNGGVANFSANNVNLSDRREKTNFAPAGDYLAKICAIPVQTFNYINQDLEDDPGLTLGVVAQDVQAIAPELVTETKLGTGEDGEKRLAIYQTDLQYALMKCIQEQQAIITQLQADVAAMKGQA